MNGNGMFHIWSGSVSDPYPPIIVVIGTNSGDPLKKVYPGLKTKVDGGNYSYVSDRSLARAWALCSEYVANWPHLCQEVRVVVEWVSEEYLRDRIPFISATGKLLNNPGLGSRGNGPAIKARGDLYEDLLAQAKRHVNVNSGLTML